MSKEFPSPLLVLHSDLWDTILSYSEGSAFCKLFLVGNRALNAKLSRVRAATIHWSSTDFCVWNKSIPLLKRFSKLHSLTLSAERSYQLSKGVPSSQLFPSTLTSLKLTFANAMTLLTNPNPPFKDLNSLTSLYINSYEPAEAQCYKINLAQFKQPLLHLTLGKEADAYPNYSLINFDQLPPNLISFESSIIVLDRTETNQSIFPIGSPGGDSTLERLAIVTPPRVSIDITSVSSTLRYLKISERVCFNGVDRFTPEDNCPLRSIFPQLHTLILPRNHPDLPWRLFETFPLSLTHLEAPLDLSDHTSASSFATCHRLNQEYLSPGFDRDNRPGAPAMLRVLRSIGISHGNLGSFIPYLINLEVLINNRIDDRIHTIDLPKSLRTLHLNSLSGSLSHMPPQLQELRFTLRSNLAIDNPLPPLVKLLVPSNLPEALISLLPSTLEYLDVIIASNEVMDALKRRANYANRLPVLSSLKIRGRDLGTVATPEPIYISASALPATITSLVLAGDIQLSLPNFRDSLADHTNLKHLDISYEEAAWKLLPQLPVQLRTLTVRLAEPIDLNHPESIPMLLNLPPNLLKLSFGYNKWFKPFGHLAAFPQSGPYFLRGPKTQLLRLLSAVISPNILYRLSEAFAVSCLPRSIISLELSFDEVNLSTWGFSKASHRIQEFFWELNYEYWPQHLLTAHLSLFAPLMPSFYRVPQVPCPGLFQALFVAFPPRLSQIGNLPGEVLRAFRLQAKARFRPKEIESVATRYLLRSTFCVANILTWAFFLSSDLLHLPGILRFLPWVNIIGSALILPLQTRVHRKALGHESMNTHTQKKVLFVLLALMSSCALLTNYAAAVGLGYTTSKWSIGNRVLGFGAAFVGELMLLGFCNGY